MTYDYIFCGFGLSTILVINELIGQNLLEGKSLLILESNPNYPEQTWCFWEDGPGKWDSLLAGKWKKGYFETEEDRLEILGGLVYKCVSAKTLRKHLLDLLSDYQSIIKTEQVIEWIDNGTGASVSTKQQTYTAKLFFNSAYAGETDILKSELLLQHFEGWYIKTDALPFATAEATIMDFTVDQKGNTRFMYILPFSKQEALVEYTMFSPALIPKEEYGEAIAKYLKGKDIVKFEIRKKEAGIIPMTTHSFWKKNTPHVLHIGTAGGWTRPSTGYTFSNGIKMAVKVAEAIKNGNIDFRKFHKRTRFDWYDKLFINVLYNENAIGKTLFRSLFSKGSPKDVMHFLNGETDLSEEIRIILACPKKPFLSAVFRTFLKK